MEEQRMLGPVGQISRRVSDIAAALAPRPLQQSGLVDGQNRLVTESDLTDIATWLRGALGSP